jgi:hypothetical protein
MDGSLAGTDSERDPGTGAGGTHPAPAAMLTEDGVLRQHGEGPNSPGNQVPVGDSSDEHAGGDVSPEAAAKLGAVVDSAESQQETDRPDLGTPTN